MLTVIPSINCPAGEADCVEKKLRLAETFAEWVHLDVADASFTHNRSWGDPKKWLEFNSTASPVRNGISKGVKLEVHLMTEHPEWYLEAWLAAGAKRVIVHLETLVDPQTEVVELAERCRAAGAELMVALLPETPLDQAKPLFGTVSSFQIFSQAYPGPAGQPFLSTVLPKIRELRAAMPRATIEVDGGINLETARLAVVAGADVLIAGSYTLGSKNPAEAYRELCALDTGKVSRLQVGVNSKFQAPNSPV